MEFLENDVVNCHPEGGVLPSCYRNPLVRELRHLTVVRGNDDELGAGGSCF